MTPALDHAVPPVRVFAAFLGTTLSTLRRTARYSKSPGARLGWELVSVFAGGDCCWWSAGARSGVCDAPGISVASILAVACRRYGFDSDAAEVIRMGENALYRCPGGVVVRIARAGQQASAVREIRVARWLASHGMPAVAALEWS
ncbi:hypothetical protein [Embleya sp. MST-111070]|uniref:hypothetical protein n=1 Tax=Embleya sp. MST-111070 TaxID=3398231 RepID=UPI003F741EE8